MLLYLVLEALEKINMKILITNDDGINSLGIRTLIKTLATENEIYIIAPDRERSATGHSLTLHKPLRVQEIDLDIPNTKAWQTTGTPTDCVKLAMCSILGPDSIDLVITGINHGPNLGADILYSGTVNAAIEGAIYDIPSIAISLTDGSYALQDFEGPSKFLLEFIKELPKLEIPKKTILNINFPPNTNTELSNVRFTELGTRNYCDCYEKRTDPRGKIYYWLAGEPIVQGEKAESDVMAIQKGHISITPIHYRLTDMELLVSLKDKFPEK
jgi:5'-nucleotidase